MVKGVVSQVIGPVVDVAFDGQDVQLPSIHDALEVKRHDGSRLVLEV